MRNLGISMIGDSKGGNWLTQMYVKNVCVCGYNWHSGPLLIRYCCVSLALHYLWLVSSMPVMWCMLLSL